MKICRTLTRLLNVSFSQGTEVALQLIPKSELQWSILCVAWMYPKSDQIVLLSEPQHHSLVVAVSTPPEWQDSWLRSVPWLGEYLNMFANVSAYSTKLEDVADLLAEDFEKGSSSPYICDLVGMKEPKSVKVA